jgi:hypothetical protein
MPVKMRRNFSGASSARLAQDGSWRIQPSSAPETQIIVIGADADSVQACGAALYDVSIEWRGQRVLLMARNGGRAATIEARSAIVHESAPKLYTALPLARFDARARRFWRRVFILVRIPGGRRLLGILARASRNKS